MLTVIQNDVIEIFELVVERKKECFVDIKFKFVNIITIVSYVQ